VTLCSSGSAAACWWLLAAIGRCTCSLTAQYFSAKAALGFGTALRKDLFRHIDTLSYSELDGIGTPTLVTRMTSDINQVQNGVNLMLRLLLRSPFIVIGALIMAYTISPRLTLLFVAATVVISLIIYLIMRATVPIYHDAQNGLDKVTLLHPMKTTWARAWCGRSPAKRTSWPRLWKRTTTCGTSRRWQALSRR